MEVVSTSAKLEINDWCCFGDIEDIFFERQKPVEGDTNNSKCKREFIKGNYNVHIVKYNSCRYCENAKTGILCEDSIDPLKIHRLLMNSNIGLDFKNPNYMSRYDWMEYRNWGSDDHDDFVFFVDESKIEILKRIEFNINRENDWVLSLTDMRTNRSIGFIIDAHASGLVCGDWHYGCVFVDKATEKCFAFVFETHYTVAPAWHRKVTVDVSATNYTYDMKGFLKR